MWVGGVLSVCGQGSLYSEISPNFDSSEKWSYLSFDIPSKGPSKGTLRRVNRHIYYFLTVFVGIIASLKEVL